MLKSDLYSRLNLDEEGIQMDESKYHYLVDRLIDKQLGSAGHGIF